VLHSNEAHERNVEHVGIAVANLYQKFWLCALYSMPLFQLMQGPRYGKWTSAVQWRQGVDLVDAAVWIDGDAHVAGLVFMWLDLSHLVYACSNYTVSCYHIILGPSPGAWLPAGSVASPPLGGQSFSLLGCQSQRNGARQLCCHCGCCCCSECCHFEFLFFFFFFFFTILGVGRRDSS